MKRTRKITVLIFILSTCARRLLALDKTAASDFAVTTNGALVGNYTAHNTAMTAAETYRQLRWMRPDREDYVASEQARTSRNNQDQEADSPDHTAVSETKVMSQPRYVDYWNGYYDFLINEGSYKFWAVFQLVTAAILIYSGFAAKYYAKINPQIPEDYDDYSLNRRRRYADWNGPLAERSFAGFRPELFQRIIDAISEDLD